MKRYVMYICSVFLIFGLCNAAAFADSPSIQDLRFNVPGGFIDTSVAGAHGVNLGGYNSSTGLGTITYTTTNSGYFNAWFDEQVAAPFFNEFGTAVGSLGTGQSWEIGDSFVSSIFNDASAGLLTNTNSLPQGASNYLNTCNGACNGDVATALGYSFLLQSGNKEIITINVSQSAPTSGFYLRQTHPADDGNVTASDVYFSLSAQEVPIGNPGVTPEPSSWILLLTGMGAAATQLRRRFRFTGMTKLLGVVAVIITGLLLAPLASAQSVKTVPWDPANLAAPHTAYPGASIILGATFDTGGLPGPFVYSWNFGDGTAATAAVAVSNPNDISATHTYAGGTVDQTWTAVVTVTDNTTHAQYTGNYLVIWENNTLKSRVNVAIDKGLWYLHQSMYHPSPGVGYWSSSCASGFGYTCAGGYGSLDATNVQAFEVNGHLPTGPASDPYTSDVQQGMNHMFTYLSTATVQSKSYTYNTATANYGCSDGSSPQPGGACAAGTTKVFFNPGGTTCAASGSCTFTFDGNSNGLATFAYQSGSWGYEDGMFADALVASSNPNGVATAGPVAGQKYKDIVQDIADAAAYCQYGGDDYDVTVGYPRGGYPYQGGGWWYSCRSGDDNSVSQWAAIGLIGGQRGFGLAIPKIVTDANNMWVTASQDTQTGSLPIPNNPGNSSSDAFGAFGYNGALNYSNAWGPFAVTPSGMVQMSMDGIGRTKSVTFGDTTSDPDQRFNNAETYYADNFCNSLTGNYANAYYSPRNYTYGLFSFTKSMLLHNPNGVLTPIQFLRTKTPGVFTTNNSVPANTIDWYAALSPANGGTDPCDGVAQTIVGRQNPAGYWYGDNYSGSQYPYETAWSLIMLQRTVFVNCVNNLGGKGTPKGANPARIDLTWTGIPNVTGYQVLRSATSGGPYLPVGTTPTTVYSDRVGLTSGSTYFYVLQPLNGSSAVCQSNQATIKIPVAR